MTSPDYCPAGNAYYAYMALYDPVKAKSDGWVLYGDVQANRGQLPGSDGADWMAGLDELVTEEWAEVREGRSAFDTAWRLTAVGSELGKQRLRLS